MKKRIEQLKQRLAKIYHAVSMKIAKALKLDMSNKAVRNRKRKWFIVLMLAIPLTHFMIFFVYVNIDTFILSFLRFDFLTSEYHYVGLQNYKNIIEDIQSTEGLRIAIRNSLWFFPVTNLIILPLSVVSAYFIFRKVPGRNIFKVIFFLPSIISIVVLTMSFQFMFDPLFGPVNMFMERIGISPVGGWFGNKQTVMPMIFIYCIWAGIGFNMVLLNGAIARLPKEVIESGRIDGIGMYKEMTQIIIPMIWPTITTLFVIGTTAVFTIFLQNLLLANGGPSGSSKTVAFIVVEQVQAGNLPSAAAFGILFSIIGIPIIFTIKYLMEKIGQNVEY